MSFDTPLYFVFLAAVVLAYWRLPWRGQNLLLLVASYVFYGLWDWRFLFLIATSTVVDYWLALVIARAQNPVKRHACLVTSVVMNLGFLGFFKYFNFFIDSYSHMMQWLVGGHTAGPWLQIILPAGISFYTFQAVAYIVDVYYRKMEPSQDFLSYALFISFFPHLVAGPIQRPSHLLPQASAPRVYEPRRIFDGLMLIAVGLFRKCVIADNCALLANAAFAGNFGEPSLLTIMVGVYAFAWQIYGDFSGYSDIARGSAQLFGFHFMVNFRQPYLATSLSDLWRRWHISLSSWLRDYIYVPLGGNRRGTRRTYANLAATMLLGGLWHGANWTFVLWGAIHGAGLAVERWLGLKPRAPSPSANPEEPGSASPPAWRVWLMRIAIFHFVCFTWLFFRAASIADAWQLLKGLGHWTASPEHLTALKFLCIFTVPLLLVDLWLERSKEEYPGENWGLRESRSGYVRRACLAVAFLVMVLFLGATESRAFIYFQF